MKIGLLTVCYKAEKYFSQAIKPWLELRNEGKLDLSISCFSALFKERWDLGETYNQPEFESMARLLLSDTRDDLLFSNDKNLLDFQARNLALQPLLSKRIDLLWQVDLADEIYTKDQILSILDFIDNEKWVDWYKVRFKNYFNDEKHYVKGFMPPRIHWNTRRGGINSFYWDNNIQFKDGMRDEGCAHAIIPEKVALVKHYSWNGTPEFLRNKVAYQHKAIGTCSYKFDDQANKLVLDLNYYSKYGVEQPKIYEDY